VRRTILRIVAIVVALPVVYFGVTFVQVWRASSRDQARTVDAIVVFGAAQYDGRPSPVLQSRLDHAADLYRRDLARYVVVTGGRRPGDRTTEASASAAYLTRHGVPESALLREIAGQTSWQSLASAANFLRQRGQTRVLLVSDPFHNARIAAMADELGLDAYVSPTRTSPIGGAEEVRYLAKETVAVGLGRVVGYRRVAGIKSEVERVQAGR
jgi:uncharacterized SAM-binding protein YcdF (DUF218 family)